MSRIVGKFVGELRSPACLSSCDRLVDAIHDIVLHVPIQTVSHEASHHALASPDSNLRTPILMSDADSHHLVMGWDLGIAKVVFKTKIMPL